MCVSIFCTTSDRIISRYKKNPDRSYHICGYVCGNKMPTRCNRGFYCRSYCLFNMFRIPLCPSSGAQDYYTMVAACGISCCDFKVAGLVWSWGLCVRFAGCCSILQTGHIKMTRGTNLMQKLWFIIINNSTCFGHVYVHLQECGLCTAACGVQN